jgi:hypothetical protein
VHPTFFLLAFLLNISDVKMDWKNENKKNREGE